MPEKSSFLTSLSLQNDWSIRVQLCLLNLVGRVMRGKRPFVTKTSKYFWYLCLSLIWRRSMLKSPATMAFELFFPMLVSIGLISSLNRSMVALLLLCFGGRYMLPMASLPSRNSPWTSMNRPSHRSDWLYWPVTVKEYLSRRYIKRPPQLLADFPEWITKCKAAVYPLLTYWGYCCFALSHWDMHKTLTPHNDLYLAASMQISPKNCNNQHNYVTQQSFRFYCFAFAKLWRYMPECHVSPHGPYGALYAAILVGLDYGRFFKIMSN